MYLTIDTVNSFIELKGVLNKSNTEVFEHKIEQALAEFDKITINIENLDSIDSIGVKAFASLHEKSLYENKRVSIVGTGCKELYDHFKTQIPTGNAA